MPLGGTSPLGPFIVVGHEVMVIGAPWLSAAGTGGQPVGVLNPVGASATDWLINRANAPNASASAGVVKIRRRRKWRLIFLLLLEKLGLVIEQATRVFPSLQIR